MPTFVFTAPILDSVDTLAVAALLSEADRVRLQGMQAIKRRREFVSGRLLVRQSLAVMYGERALAWSIEPQPSGALRVCGDHESMPAISLSHSKGRVACALAEASLLGIDIERVQPRKSLADLAAEVLHPHEFAEFQRLETKAQLEFFYAKWVLKEALGKALGYGVHYPMHEVLINDGCLTATPQPWAFDSGSWWFSHTLLDGEYSLGLACQGGTDNSISISRVEIRI